MKRKKIKTGLTEYFNFSARERRGAFILTIILIAQIGVLIYFRNHEREIIPPDPELVALILADTIEPVATTNSFTKKNEIVKAEYFFFNPNELDSADWVKLGLSPKQAKVIPNYVAKGGKFKTKTDLKKMYCIDEKKYELLEPFIVLPEVVQNTFAKTNFEKKKTKVIVDFSKADTMEMMCLRGIGPVLASRIYKYRERLGGFYSIFQLKEVYGITDSLFISLEEKIMLSDSIPFRFIHLNSDTFQVLSSHPYIKKQLATLIISYRKQHKGFNSVEDIKNIPLIEDENFRKLAPYLRPD